MVEEFLRSSTVCALTTGIGDYVRCTPLEYSFHDGQFWIFTEGGEKFIGLENNKNVSLAVFEKNPNFGELKSVQVMGTAKLIEPMSADYVAHAEHKKIPVAALQNEYWSEQDILGWNGLKKYIEKKSHYRKTKLTNTP